MKDFKGKERLKNYLNAVSPLSETTFFDVEKLFQKETLSKDDFFVNDRDFASKIAFLEQGVVRAFFTNSDDKQYNKQFFVGPALIGAYTSLITKQRNNIPQQALTDCLIWVADYKAIKNLFEKHHDFERLGRKIAEFYFLEKEQKELDMALMNATERYLLFREKFPTLEQEIHQYHIASYLGISTTQLSRLRNKLKNKNH